MAQVNSKMYLLYKNNEIFTRFHLEKVTQKSEVSTEDKQLFEMTNNLFSDGV